VVPSVADAESHLPSIDELYRQHARAIVRWAEHLGGPGIDGDEVVQDVFLVANRRWAEFRGDAQPRTWLFRITAGIVANQRRSLRRRRLWTRLGHMLSPLSPAPSPAPDEGIGWRHAERRFHACLEGLSEQYRQVLVLFEMDELSTEDIARLIGRPPTTVRVWLHRARAQFEKRWQASLEAEER